MQTDMARRIGQPQKCRSVRKRCACGDRIGMWEKKKSIGVGEPEVVTIPNLQDLCGLSPINLVRFRNALSGRAAGQYAAVLFLHDSDAGHDMWSRSISRNTDSDSNSLPWAEARANGGRIQNWDAEGG